MPPEAKAATRRNYLFEQARAALAKHDLATAKAKAAAYAAEVAARKVPFELRQQQEIEGLIALEEKRYAAAAQAFAKANQQDPRILYLDRGRAEGRRRHRARGGDGRQGRDVQSAQLQLRLRPSQGREDAGHVRTDARPPEFDGLCEGRRTRPHAILSSSGQSFSPFVRKWRNWQTRKPQELVLAREWRFKSSLPHQPSLSIQAKAARHSAKRDGGPSQSPPSFGRQAKRSTSHQK